MTHSGVDVEHALGGVGVPVVRRAPSRPSSVEGSTTHCSAYLWIRAPENMVRENGRSAWASAPLQP